MKKISLLFFITIFTNSIYSQTISSFENLSLASDTFWNGSDLTGGFISGNISFPNSYDTTYSIWSGFVYSNKKDSVTAGSVNQQSAITASGYNSSTYAVCNDYGLAYVNINGGSKGKLVDGFYVTNATYTYLSMRDGDAFAKKFGGTSGNDADWLKLTANGFLNGTPSKVSAEIYLADFRFTDNTQDYLLREWTWFNLLPLGNVDSIQFSLTSSDTGQFGMNTPAYFALDNFTCKDVLNVAPVSANDMVSTSYLNDTLIDVASNDFDTTAIPLTINLLTSPQVPGASATVVNNRIQYTPAIGLVTVDTLLYTICDVAGECDTALLVISITGINDIGVADKKTLSMYPNPTIDVLHVTTPGITSGNFLVRNFSGQIVLSQEINTESFTMRTDDLPSGLYLAQLSVNGSVITQKLVKE